MIEIRIPGRPPGGNALHRMTHWQVRKEREYWQTTTQWAVLEAGWRGEPMERVTLDIDWHCRTKRRRDWDNLLAGLKPVLDGLVSSRLLKDDSTDNLVFGVLRVIAPAERDEIIIRVFERAA